jgi:hypothetical protein
MLLPVKKEKLLLGAIAMTLGGPAANLATGYAVFLLPFAKGFFWGCFVFSSVLGGIGNLFGFGIDRPCPMVSGCCCMFDRPRAERWLAMARLGAELREGVPPESLPPDFLAKAVAVRDRSPDTATAHSLAYAAAFCRHDDAAAASLPRNMIGILRLCSTHGAPSADERCRALSDPKAQANRSGRTVAGDDSSDHGISGTPTEGRGRDSRGQRHLDGAVKKLDQVEALFLQIPNKTMREINLRFCAAGKTNWSRTASRNCFLADMDEQRVTHPERPA